MSTAGNVTIGDWTFSGPVHLDNQNTGNASWSGPVVVGGSVMVSVGINGAEPVLITWPIEVMRRQWTWAGTQSGRQAAAGEVDGCIQPVWGLTGLMTNAQCQSVTQRGAMIVPPEPYAGASFASISGGPNNGVHYVSVMPGKVDLVYQMRRDYRPDGAIWPLGSGTVNNGCITNQGNSNWRNVFEVNTHCVPTGHQFAQFSSFVWAHEADHLTRALSAAVSPHHDLWAVAEPLVATEETWLRVLVGGKVSDVSNHIFEEAMKVHNGGSTAFAMWLPVVGGWSLGSVITEH